jgi:hypothetical protein
MAGITLRLGFTAVTTIAALFYVTSSTLVGCSFNVVVSIWVFIVHCSVFRIYLMATWCPNGFGGGTILCLGHVYSSLVRFCITLQPRFFDKNVADMYRSSDTVL